MGAQAVLREGEREELGGTLLFVDNMFYGSMSRSGGYPEVLSPWRK
jgi:hypothetical protein